MYASSFCAKPALISFKYIRIDGGKDKSSLVMQNDKLFIVLHVMSFGVFRPSLPSCWRAPKAGTLKNISNKCTQIAQVNIKKSLHCFFGAKRDMNSTLFGIILAGHEYSINYVLRRFSDAVVVHHLVMQVIEIFFRHQKLSDNN